MIFSLCACGSAKESVSAEAAYGNYRAAAEESAYSGLAGASYDMAMDADYEAAASEEAPAPAATAATSSGNGAESGQETYDSKIIYTGDTTIETLTYDDTVAAFLKLVEDRGGYIESSSVNSGNYSAVSSGKKIARCANYTIRVPADVFDEIMNSFTTLGNVPYCNVYSDNITSQYYDSQARLSNYQLQEQRLNELLAKANTVSEILEIERELSDVRYHIESLQGTIKNWDRQVAYSAIYVCIQEVYEYTPEQQVTYGKRLKEAAEDGFEALSDFVLVVVEALPVLIVLVILVILLIKLIKALTKKKPGKTRRERKAEKAAAAQAAKDLPAQEEAPACAEKDSAQDMKRNESNSVEKL